MTQIPGVWVETIASPTAYTYQQVEGAVQVAAALDRGKFILTDPPPHDCEQAVDDNGVCHWCRRRYFD